MTELFGYMVHFIGQTIMTYGSWIVFPGVSFLGLTVAFILMSMFINTLIRRAKTGMSISDREIYINGRNDVQPNNDEKGLSV